MTWPYAMASAVEAAVLAAIAWKMLGCWAALDGGGLEQMALGACPAAFALGMACIAWALLGDAPETHRTAMWVLGALLALSWPGCLWLAFACYAVLAA